MKQLFAILTVTLLGCTGTVGDTDAGQPAADAGFDAGPRPIEYTQFTQVAAGWPTNAVINGAATLDSVLYVSTDRGLWALEATSTQWAPVVIPLIHDAPPTSLALVGQQLVMTAAGESAGGLFVRPFDGEWAQAAGAPVVPCWALRQRNGEWLLVTTGGLFAASALEGAWTRRSSEGEPLFGAAITHFVASAAAQKLFADGAFDAGLYESIDEGATWGLTLDGGVQALAADGAQALLALDGQQLRSDNYGSTFHAATQPLSGSVSQLVFQGGRVWAATSEGLFVSGDRGLTFSEALEGFPSGAAARGIWFAGSYAVVDTTGGPWVNQP